MSQLFRDLAAGIAADVARRADADGVVPRTATFELQRQSAERIQRLYLGRNRAGELAPFETLANGRVIALAPYPQALWSAITAAVRLPVEENAAILTKRLPDDILDVMRRARVDPFAAVGAKVAEVEVFRPNPLATYEAPHTWVDPNGYRLSDRIWNVAAAERSRLDAYLDDSIKRGTGALTMAKELEQFLDPSRKTLTTNKPYGSKASYDAMRLARSEITQAHGQAQQASAAMNPFVQGLKWVLSPRHPKPDICDSYARGGPNGDGVYPLGETPRYPAHPQCLCLLLNAMTPDPDAVITSLRDDIRAARADLVDKIGPLQVENFDRLLLGETLPAVVVQPAPVAVALPVPVPAVAPIAPPVPAVPQTAGDAARQLLTIRDQFAGSVREADELKRRFDSSAADLARLTKRQDDILVESVNASPERRRALTKESTQIRKEIREIQRIRSTYTPAILDVYKERAAAARAVLAVDDPAANKLAIGKGFSPEATALLDEGLAGFNRLVSKTVWSGDTVYVDPLPAGQRSYAIGALNRVFLATNDGPEIVVHELAHVLETQGGKLDEVLRYFDKRTAGDSWESLRALTGNQGFADSERTKKDKWIEPYMGADYQRKATELLSLGLQRMYQDPISLAEQDSDLFGFLYNLLRGR